MLDPVAPAPPRSALRPDGSRALVVISQAGELAAALRQRLPRDMVVVRDARPTEAGDVISSCTPFPWMILGDEAVAPEAAVTAARRHPVILAWLGQAPAGAPAHTRQFARFADVAAFVNVALSRSLGGMRLGRGAGVDLDSGEVLRSASLEALVSLHPAGFDLPPALFRSASRSLSRRRIAWRPARDRTAGGVVLRPRATVGMHR